MVDDNIFEQLFFDVFNHSQELRTLNCCTRDGTVNVLADYVVVITLGKFVALFECPLMDCSLPNFLSNNESSKYRNE